jgi:DnaJ-class molecular chaperone
VDEEYERCPRCKGKGEVPMLYEFDESDPLVRSGRRRTDKMTRCPVCNGEGRTRDPAAEARAIALRKSLEERDRPRQTNYFMKR